MRSKVTYRDVLFDGSTCRSKSTSLGSVQPRSLLFNGVQLAWIEVVLSFGLRDVL